MTKKDEFDKEVEVLKRIHNLSDEQAISFLINHPDFLRSQQEPKSPKKTKVSRGLKIILTLYWVSAFIIFIILGLAKSNIFYLIPIAIMWSTMKVLDRFEQSEELAVMKKSRIWLIILTPIYIVALGALCYLYLTVKAVQGILFLIVIAGIALVTIEWKHWSQKDNVGFFKGNFALIALIVIVFFISMFLAFLTT